VTLAYCGIKAENEDFNLSVKQLASKMHVSALSVVMEAFARDLGEGLELENMTGEGDQDGKKKP